MIRIAQKFELVIRWDNKKMSIVWKEKFWKYFKIIYFPKKYFYDKIYLEKEFFNLNDISSLQERRISWEENKQT